MKTLRTSLVIREKELTTLRTELGKRQAEVDSLKTSIFVVERKMEEYKSSIERVRGWEDMRIPARHPSVERKCRSSVYGADMDGGIKTPIKKAAGGGMLPEIAPPIWERAGRRKRGRKERKVQAARGAAVGRMGGPKTGAQSGCGRGWRASSTPAGYRLEERKVAASSGYGSCGRPVRG